MLQFVALKREKNLSSVFLSSNIKALHFWWDFEAWERERVIIIGYIFTFVCSFIKKRTGIITTQK